MRGVAGPCWVRGRRRAARGLAALLVPFFTLALALLWTKRDWSAKTHMWLSGATVIWPVIAISIAGKSSPSPTNTGADQPGISSSIAAPSTSEPPTTALTATPVTPPPGSALAVLATLAVKGRAPKTGYARDRFGTGWVDTNRNGCDTRIDW